MANIKDRGDFDPFPKSGLVRQYEPFIRSEVSKFCRRYPHVRRQDFLVEAIRLASRAEQLFKSWLGYDFSTLLRHYLKELQRFAESQDQRVRIYETDAEIERRKSEEGGGLIKAVDFSGGGNGARITFDLQWHTPAAVTVTGQFKPMTRHRVIAGAQLGSADRDHAEGVAALVSEALPSFLEGQEPSPTLRGRMRAIFADAERCQREADREAENRKNGDYNPVFYWPSANKSDAQFYQGKKPPKFDPEHIPMARLDDAYGHDEEWVLHLHETIAGSAGGSSDEPDWFDRVEVAAERERPFLSPKEKAILDWMLAPRGRTLTQIAAENEISKGYASKLQAKIIEALKRRLKD